MSIYYFFSRAHLFVGRSTERHETLAPLQVGVILIFFIDKGPYPNRLEFGEGERVPYWNSTLQN